MTRIPGHPRPNLAPDSLAGILVRQRSLSGKINAEIARDAWIDEGYVSKLLAGEKYRPSRDALIRLAAFGLSLSIPDVNELLMAAEYLPIVSPKSIE